MNTLKNGACPDHCVLDNAFLHPSAGFHRNVRADPSSTHDGPLLYANRLNDLRAFQSRVFGDTSTTLEQEVLVRLQ